MCPCFFGADAEARASQYQQKAAGWELAFKRRDGELQEVMDEAQSLLDEAKRIHRDADRDLPQALKATRIGELCMGGAETTPRSSDACTLPLVG